MAEIPSKLIDKRVIERNIRKGLVSKTDFARHLEELPDRSDNAEVIPLADLGSDDQDRAADE